LGILKSVYKANENPFFERGFFIPPQIVNLLSLLNNLSKR